MIGVVVWTPSLVIVGEQPALLLVLLLSLRMINSGTLLVTLQPWILPTYPNALLLYKWIRFLRSLMNLPGALGWSVLPRV